MMRPDRGVCWLAVVLSLGPAAQPVMAPPQISFGHVQYNAGVVFEGAPVVHVYPFTNRGDRPLRVLSAEVSCGCTEATVIGGDVVAPGAVAEVRVATDTTGKRGRFTKEIEVTSDDPAQPVTALTLTGRVVKDVAAHRGHNLQAVIFGERCGGCHAEPAAGLTGAPLYEAVCAYCHGEKGHGGGATALKRLSYLRRVSAGGLRVTIGQGRPDEGMPGFHRAVGGPLDDAQVESLVTTILGWRGAIEAEIPPVR
jgi:mono/diheme cytochrome c family protein